VTDQTALAPHRAALVRVSAAVATRRPDRLEEALRAAATCAAPEEVDEVLLQAHLFVGFPDALEALLLWRSLGGSSAPAPSPEEPVLWAARGPQVCATVYGANYRKLRSNVAALHPDLDRWMVDGGYGRVIGRPGLDLATRELCIVALLAVWNAPRQLHSHLRGALNAGATPHEVGHAVHLALAYLEPPAAQAVRDLWRTLAARRPPTPNS
jgi:4-carboxymuconolactone decarboxylase